MNNDEMEILYEAIYYAADGECRRIAQEIVAAENPTEGLRERLFYAVRHRDAAFAKTKRGKENAQKALLSLYATP